MNVLALSLSQFFQGFLENDWYSSCKFQHFTSSRMGEAQRSRVQKLAMSFQRPTRSIDFISSHRMSNVGHMDANLMGSACFQLKLNQAIVTKTFQDLETRQSWLAFSRHSLLLAVFFTAANRSLNHPTVIRQIPMNNSSILA